MIFDDRLDTVLRTAAAGPAAARTQFRQIIDILGRVPEHDWSTEHFAAIGRLDSLAAVLPDDDRAALVRSAQVRSPALVDHFAHQSPRIAAGAIGGARLTEAQWLDLIPRLPLAARGYLRHRRELGPDVERMLERFGIGDRALPLPAGFEPNVVEGAAPAPLPFPVRKPVAVPDATANPAAEATPPVPLRAADPDDGRNGIGAIVRRIDAFRRQRENAAPPGPLASGDPGDPRLPLADEALAPPPPANRLQFRSDATGTIISAEGAAAAMLVGHRPFDRQAGAPAQCDDATARAAIKRQPIAAGRIELEGAPAISGAWRIDAVPRFAKAGGRFIGYHGVLRRPTPAAPADLPVPASAMPAEPEGDRLRQLLHELRTPINAIQGFAELIQQQIFGPTPHQYRSLAASIASDAAQMLAGFEELERLVKLEAGQVQPDAGETDAGALLARLIAQMQPALAAREVRLTFEPAAGPVMVALAEDEAERLLWRVLAVFASTVAPGERLRFAIGPEAAPEGTPNATAEGSGAQIVLSLPAALAALDDAALFAPDARRGLAVQASAILGNGFALRLAAAEAKAAGGRLFRADSRLIIILPGLTARAAHHSQDQGLVYR
ncbi:sensor histidine kinase [Novosphingobium lentum]|uniref:sensor histidine kinase n=1 Tax=Novosphingobium lentum TaxID=145287 RepID=UPI000B0FAA59|nr:histidine kinase dimerization/phospho-acceptor domain-containing protein [Novosphingobium lentum]